MKALIVRAFLLSLLFFLTKKVTKKSRRFDACDLLVRRFLLTNRRVGRVISLTGLRLGILIRAMRGFLEALYFSLHAVLSPHAFCK
jgi:hypothetical protein